MASTTFNGPVRSEKGFQVATKNTTTGAITTRMSSGMPDLTGLSVSDVATATSITLAADTIFLKNNRKKFDLIIGMYHDQVLTPMKTLFEYNAINITIGLPFIRVSPDHGPNESMLGKNKSNYLSLLNSIKFLDF